jgi:DNA-binding transcriptional MocR family regulator
LIYLELVLGSSYQQETKDRYQGSIRTLAARVGVTVSAVRNSLKQLQSLGMVSPIEGGWIVKKWIEQPAIIPRRQRPKPEQQPINISEEQQVTAEQLNRERWLEKLRQQGIDELIFRFEENIKAAKRTGGGPGYEVINNINYQRLYDDHCRQLKHEPLDYQQVIDEIMKVKRKAAEIFNTRRHVGGAH